MTNYNFTGKEISKKLDTKIIQNGGLTIMTMPVIKCEIDGERKTEFGGYSSLVNYNREREEQHRQDRFNRKMRKLRRNVRNKKLGQEGLTHTVNTIIMQADLIRDSYS